ncbi:MAG: hypothetical protein GY696_18680, partial [Gammaproteobacteria bacterium]|nr:hypothetical protein [Gammaproteobacteria bacterium]
MEAVQHQRWDNLQLSGPAAKVYKEVRKELKIKDGVLYRGSRIVPPSVLRKEILSAAHVGHPGITRNIAS